MKKVTLLIALMLLVSAFTFAQDEPFSGPNGAPTVSGSVTLVVGYDLDTEASGFDNSTDLTLRFPLADGADTKGGDDDIYGEITIDGIGWNIQPNKFYDSDEDADAADASKLDASIGAKIVMGDVFISLNGPGFSMNNVDVSKDYAVDANLFVDDNNKSWSDGMSVGYTTDMFSIEVKVASKGNYAGPSTDDADTDTVTDLFDNDTDTDEGDADSTELNDENQYIVGVSATIKPADGVEIPVSVFYDMFYANEVSLIGFGTNPSIKIAPITIALPVDVVATVPTTGDADYGFEVGPSITFDIISGGSNVAIAATFGAYAEAVNPGSILDASLTFTETETDGFVDGLALTVKAALTDLMDNTNTTADMGWAVDVDGSFNLDGIKPYVNFGYGNDEVFDLGVGVTLMADGTGIDNTEITIDYTNESITSDEATTEKGRVTATVKVSY